MALSKLKYYDGLLKHLFSNKCMSVCSLFIIVLLLLIIVSVVKYLYTLTAFCNLTQTLNKKK